MNGGVPSKELNETLLNILDQLESDSNLLDNSDNIKYIISLLGEGADKNTKSQAEKTLSDYLNEKLSDILNKLESDRALLGNHNCTQHIMLLLEVGANPNVQNRVEKTLLHYVAERNDIDGIEFLLKKGASSKIRDHSGKIPSDYATEFNCLQVLKDLRDISNDKTTCTKLRACPQTSKFKNIPSAT
ncbi:hypothetical protein HC358_04230 [Wolbachia pipientis]|uniref:Uncharacterized protein n=1 Tax=Wolbachia pipientis TaxID=955 RepID=A0A7G5CAK8_WOLPI|nr:ankyrin repeat domain-containing protein [Wolbachia pipientis]QMV46242.1 hypothetical protein HC358_04230 [Wolbachia pipientis]